MAIDKQKIAEMISLMQKKYPGWTSFSDPSYIKDEVDYKRDAIKKADKLLSESELSKLLDASNFDEIITRLKTIGATNLLWKNVPAAGDLAILENDKLDKHAFGRQIFQLLYGSNTSPARLDIFLNFIRDNGLPNKWTFPTYFLFVCHPDTEMFVKPMATKVFLEYIDAENLSFTASPSGETYAAIKRLSQELKDELKDFEPHDMVDIQSLIFLCSDMIKIKKSVGTSYWKIAPGENAWNWASCREGGFIAIGWEELGDVSKLNKPQFNARREELLKENPDWNKNGVEQVWKFAHIKEGDKIIANKGTTEVLGIGTVKGPYYYVESIRHGHRLPVEWEDLTPRKINKAGWKRTLIELTPEEFNSIYDLHDSTDIYKIFKDREEAEWAFALLKDTLIRLGVVDPDDGRFALTCPFEGRTLHLDYGQWLVLGFSSPEVGPNRFEIALPADQTKFYNEFESFTFAKDKNELNIKLYKMPIELAKPIRADLRKAYDVSLDYITNKFGEWQATPLRKNHHVQEIAEAIFDDKKLEKLLNSHSKRTVWWVNQGSSIRKEHEDCILCAPKKSEGGRFFAHWERLIEIIPEDIILHYANGQLLYVSRATASAVTADRPYGRFDEVNLVRVDYYNLIPPISLSKFSGNIQELAIKDGPLNTIGGVKEGYLWRLTPEALKIIQNSQPETKWPEFSILNRTSTWIFQANPSIFDIDKAISELNEVTWRVNQHREMIHVGDAVYLWKSGADAGIVGVGKILIEPAILKDLETEKKFVRQEAAGEESDEFFGVRVSIENAFETTVSRQELLNDPLLNSMQILRQPHGTNFPLTEVEAEAIHNLIHSPRINLEYSLEQCSEETGLDEALLDSWVRAIHRKGQAIIYGPPGTGKTFVAEHLARHLIGGGYGFKDIIQFHSAYSYEDFVQGIRPKSHEDGTLEYLLVPGRFLNFCYKARNSKDTCVLIIDEINRANLARVFGELMYLLEYRGKEIPLAAGEDRFSIPENVRIIGTMNTADRSIALVDHALRRRFAFLQLQPEYNTLKLFHEQKKTGLPMDGLIQVLKSLNADIRDPHYEVGISYFIREDLGTQIEDIWKMEIEPYLEEYFFHDKEKMKNYRWDNVKSRIKP